MNNVIADFETYYDLDKSVKHLGNENYAAVSDAYILALTMPDGSVQCGTIEEMREISINLSNDPTVQMWAANSNFDRQFWKKHYDPSMPLEKDWQCILDLGAFHQMPRNLAGLSKAALGLEMDKGVRDQMKGVHYEELPDKSTDDEPLSKEKVQEYCATDVVRARDILQILPPMSAQEERIAAHTRLINRRGVYIDLDKVESDKTLLAQMKHEGFKAIPWHRDAKPLSVVELRRWCGQHGIPAPVSTAKTDEDCIELTTQYPELNAVLGAMRRFRKANTLLEKLDTLVSRINPEGRLPLDILYCGAPHTRRWSSKFFNVQNLDKVPTKVTDDGQTIWTRNWVVPPPGCMFLILDYSQVEPRCLNWLAGNVNMMNALKQGFSYYEAYAGFARGWSGAPGTLKNEYGVKKYTLLKNECLGLGYGMGTGRFIEYAAQNGAEVSQGEAKQIVDGFRANNQCITQLWTRLDRIVQGAARSADKSFEIEMPSGDVLKYFAVRPSVGKNKKGVSYGGFTVKGEFTGNNYQSNLWGGTLTENITQRFARDILAEAVVRLEDAGFPVAFHAHDEVILVVPYTEDEKQKAEIKAEAARIMTQTPEWVTGMDLPLGVDGDFSMCYTKL